MPGPTYQTLNWVLTGVAGAFTVGRYVLRSLNRPRFYWDDLIHGIAFIVLLIHTAVNGANATQKDYVAELDANKHSNPAVVLAAYQKLLSLSIVNNVFLYLVFWVVKFSFLAFYRLLFSANAKFVRWWWAAAVYAFLTYWVAFAPLVINCKGASTVAEFKQCNSADPSRAARLEYTCAVNVSSDLFIMALPLWMLDKLHMEWKKKLGLALIFSLAFVCIALDILRVVEAVESNQNLYTVLEINFVVIVSCLPTYSTLLTVRNRWRERSRSRGRSYPRSYDQSGNSRGRSDSAPLEKFQSRRRVKDPLDATELHEEHWDGSAVELNALGSSERGNNSSAHGDIESGRQAEPVDITQVEASQKRPEQTQVTWLRD